MTLDPMVRRLLPAAVVVVLLAGYFALDARRGGEPVAAFRAGALTVAEPFALATGPDATSAAGYMRIENGGGEDDRLLSATAEIADRVAIEEAVVSDGMTTVLPLAEGLEIAAGSVVQLRPGSYRLHLEGLRRQLKEGESFFGTLVFEKAGSLDVTYQVGEYVAPIGGAFSLTDQSGAPFSNGDLLGKPYAIFFGYTHCPDVCPTTLFELSRALAKLGPDAERLRVVFVTVDPARDTPDFLKEYLTAFDRRIVALTGSDKEIAEAAKTFRIFYQKVAAEDGDYTMDHSASVILMDAAGSFVGTISYGEDSEKMLAKLRRLLTGASS
jgi:protein SCO1/2